MGFVRFILLPTTAVLATGLSTMRQDHGFSIPNHWNRKGVVLERSKSDAGVVGDPCIVWDEDIEGWRMFLFHDPPGHGQSVCMDREDIGPGRWKYEGPLGVTNPEAVG